MKYILYRKSPYSSQGNKLSNDSRKTDNLPVVYSFLQPSGQLFQLLTSVHLQAKKEEQINRQNIKIILAWAVLWPFYLVYDNRTERFCTKLLNYCTNILFKSDVNILNWIHFVMQIYIYLFIANMSITQTFSNTRTCAS